MRKFLTDAGLIWRGSVREARRDIALAFVFPVLPPLFFAVLQAVTYTSLHGDSTLPAAASSGFAAGLQPSSKRPAG
jgi:hypothetical protein